ncbi:LysR family transcriptional regulator [Halomonas elongata]|uniref:LysR family transcription regulator n=1 Tax=Halomonas elongata (strain ATCC 33173 / DSM 2581 / NBRC 15536 / NCIMB 2198 / 1H9) TaxID=768066 RepID=E1V9A7_HALED|nr:LysR family transcriptional regulator [Halomonas elongata]WBF17516.1 LysR substrate-binding domain-containing protein [Halomonas elongata]WPU46355.1 LysR substrate-binding domain-containing protein [Halomonas elongata DSM 2581]CBV43779.2 LysR family transcription regulator [Halomonas elongata DSM 2581]
MDRIDQWQAFIRVAEMGSFTRAAVALAWPRATVSLAVRRLEETLGVRLLHRTTRKVRLTPDGERFLQRARTLVAEAEELERLFRQPSEEATGRLVVDVPSRVARRLVAPALGQLLARHPRLQVVLGSSDRHVDLVAEGVDCVVRFGPLQDSDLVARRLGRVALVNCASPDYLKRHGMPRQAEDLAAGHLMVGYASPHSGREERFEVVEHGQVRDIALASRVVVNNAENYIACCRAGLGLIQVPRFDVDDLLRGGDLVEVLPQSRAEGMDVSVLYPHRRHRAVRIDVFMDWFAAMMAPYLEKDGAS